MRRVIEIRRRRVRGPINPFEEAYTQILAESPTVPLLMRTNLPYLGQDTLFTDAAATDVVADIGDPIGGVRHAGTGDIIGTQTTDAQRPIYGGFGATFDDASSTEIVGPRLDPGTGSATYFVLFREDDTTSGTRINMLLRTQVSTNRAGFWFSRRTDTQAQIQLYNNAGSVVFSTVVNLPSGETFLDGEFHVISAMFSVADGTVELYWDATEIFSTSIALADITGGDPLTVGDSGGLGGVRDWTGPIPAVLGFGSRLDSAEISYTTALLLALVGGPLPPAP